MSFLQILFFGLGLVLVVEGLLYALFPDAMRRMLVAALSADPEALRLAALIAATVGAALVWIAGPPLPM